MSEIQSRPVASRGRGSARGGRGGYSSRGGRGGARSTKPETQDSFQPSFEDEGEIGQLKKKYSSSLPTLKELFPDWTNEDLVFALEDAEGDLETAIERITEGNVSQWGEVKKKHGDRARTKTKDSQAIPTDAPAPSGRGGRGRGGLESRGRARGDRGRAARGGRAGAHVNGARVDKPSAPAQVSEAPAAPAEPTPPVEQPALNEPSAPASSAWGQPEIAEKSLKSTIIPEGSKKGWASLFAKPTPLPSQKKPPPSAPTAAPEEHPTESVPEQTETVPQPEVPKEEPSAPPEPVAVVPVPQPAIPEIKPKEETPTLAVESIPVAPQEVVAPQETAATTQQQEPAQIHTPSTYAATPYKAGAGSIRGPGFQRRVLDQQEAVVMPGNHAVDRAAVQFGSMGLNGSVDDIDEEREEPETRPQPPQHSPVAPRASLPPSTQPQAPVAEPVSVPRPAPGLPPAPQTTMPDAPFNEFGRYAEAQKPYDPFSQQVDQTQPPAQEPFSSQANIPSQPAVTTAADYSAFYGADQSRNPYYYGNYGQPQDVTTSHRAAGGFATSAADVQPQVVSTQQPPGRYGHVEASNSGQNTPNPVPGQTQPAQPAQQHMPQGQGAAGAHGAYNYGYPYYPNSHYPSSYMGAQHQYGRNRPMFDDVRRYEEHYQIPHSNQYGYGNQYAPYGKGGMYGQPQHGFSYDQHSSSPANAGSFTQAGGAPSREASYGRTGSAQPSETQQTAGSNTFGGVIPDVFGRAQGGFGQNQGMSSQQPPATTDDATKNFEVPKAGGPSPSVTHANRPGSATNTAPAQPAAPGQSGLPPMPAQQGNQQAFGAYPHLNAAQYGGLGGLGSHHQAGGQGSGYGSYNTGFSSNYYGNTGRGWGGNYGH